MTKELLYVTVYRHFLHIVLKLVHPYAEKSRVGVGDEKPTSQFLPPP